MDIIIIIIIIILSLSICIIIVMFFIKDIIDINVVVVNAFVILTLLAPVTTEAFRQTGAEQQVLRNSVDHKVLAHHAQWEEHINVKMYLTCALSPPMLHRWSTFEAPIVSTASCAGGQACVKLPSQLPTIPGLHKLVEQLMGVLCLQIIKGHPFCFPEPCGKFLVLDKVVIRRNSIKLQRDKTLSVGTCINLSSWAHKSRLACTSLNTLLPMPDPSPWAHHFSFVFQSRRNSR